MSTTSMQGTSANPLLRKVLVRGAATLFGFLFFGTFLLILIPAC